MFVTIVDVSPPGWFQLHGKASIQVTCDDVMVFLPIFLHIDVVHIKTKINWLSGCVSLCFMMMRSNIVEPRILTSEPFEYTNSMLRGIQREFTVRYF